METQQFNQSLCEFLDQSPTPFHATQNLCAQLGEAGFSELDESEEWKLAAGGRYFVRRNQSSFIAWTQGAGDLASAGWRMLGAHTDSPCLKLKPNPDLYQHGYWRLGVEVYGGALLNPWFDRDLSLAGRVHYLQQGGAIASQLINFARPIATIPSLAIHLDREANSKRSVNAQKHLPVLLGVGDQQRFAGVQELLQKQLQQEHGVEAQSILDYELYFYDTQGASVIGESEDLIASARLDNLLSCYVDTRALIDTAGQGDWAMVVCNDHEEVGSQSAAGAGGPFLEQVLQRISADNDHYIRSISRSQMISTDNAHGLHPNFDDKMEPNHSPLLNAGPVIKVNANQRYASNSETQANFRELCQRHEVPVQSFVVRSDMGCGSTIGPITAAALGIKTLDVGVPTFAMHSIRELAGSEDAHQLYRVLCAYLQR